MQTTEPKDVGPGTLLGRYEILLGIAQGGMARVWAARQHGQRGFSKIVAIKTILPALASDPEFEAMFLDEARVAAGVHHPNVCEIFDLGEEQGALYLAMEWVNGESLARVLKSGPPATPGGPRTAQRLGPRIAARIVADTCAGLHAAHELSDDAGNRLSVVHRDVSPQNILLSIDGTLKITDFGVAKALGSAHQSTAAGQIKGKAAYLSPEQAAGGRVDRRSDVFALGVVLYEITTGVRPFSGETPVAMVKRLLEGRFEPPGAQLPGYPRDLESIVMRAMALDPMQRFPTADRMRVALEEWLARSGSVVTETQVAAAVRERVGSAVEERAARIRERMRSSSLEPPSAVSFPPSNEISSARSSASTSSSSASYVTATGVPSSTSSIRPNLSAGSGGTTSLLLGIGLGLFGFVVIALVIGGGWLYLRSRATPAAAGSASTSDQTAEAPPGQAGSKIIALNAITPRQGLEYELDGNPLPLRTIGLARPRPGEVKLLTARAVGYEPKLIELDEHSPEVIDVKLTESAPVDAGGSSAHVPVVTPLTPGSPKPQALRGDAGLGVTRPERKKKSIEADIPENPF